MAGEVVAIHFRNDRVSRPGSLIVTRRARPQRPLLRLLVSPAALCALACIAALGAVMQYSLRAYVPGSLEPGGLTLANFAALARPLYARVFVDTVLICLLTAGCTLVVGYPLAYALVHARRIWIKSAILVITLTPLFLGEVVRTYSWIVVLGNNGFVNAMLLKSGLLDQPLQLMFTTFGVIIALVHVTLPVMVIDWVCFWPLATVIVCWAWAGA